MSFPFLGDAGFAFLPGVVVSGTRHCPGVVSVTVPVGYVGG